MFSSSLYFDYAAATPVDPRVLEAMLPYFSEKFGNPSTIHRMGVEARAAMEMARTSTAKLINAHPDEIFFTSGATESVNLAILGAARAYKEHGRHIVSTTAEHKATLETLTREGFDVTLVPVDKDGKVSVQEILAAIQADTVLVSIIYVNNEVGTMNPIREIGKVVERYRRVMGETLPLLHVDVAQAVPYLYVDVEKEKMDFASFSASKMGGPKGAGALYVRRSASIKPLLFGGAQEHGVRPGTENVPGVVGLGKSCELTREEREANYKHVSEMRDVFVDEVQKRIERVKINGGAKDFSPHIVNLCIKGVEAEELILRLDAENIFVSAASACNNAGARSHVLQAMGYTEDEIKSSVRFSFGKQTTTGAVVKAAEALARIVEELRKKT
jgi:cysteine desulfurase